MPEVLLVLASVLIGFMAGCWAASGYLVHTHQTRSGQDPEGG